MELKYGLISADDHVQEHPEVWTRACPSKNGATGFLMSKPNRMAAMLGGRRTARFTARRRHRRRTHGRPQREPRRWDEVPPMAYDPAERLKAMDLDGVDYSVLYPTVGGLAAESFGKLDDPDLEFACVQAYNDWLIEEWASVSPRFVPQCIVPIWPMERTVAEIRRAVAKGHKGVIYPASPMELRAVPHINEPAYDPLWATCEELGVPLCFHAGASPKIQMRPGDRISRRRWPRLSAVSCAR